MVIDVSPKQAVLIAMDHVRRYTHRVRMGREGRPGINLSECERLLALWQSVLDKKGENLSLAEASEIQDARDSGEYDQFKITWGELLP